MNGAFRDELDELLREVKARWSPADVATARRLGDELQQLLQRAASGAVNEATLAALRAGLENLKSAGVSDAADVFKDALLQWITRLANRILPLP